MEKPIGYFSITKTKVNKEEKQHWIDRWNRLKPSPKRDMIIKMWGGKPKRGESTNRKRKADIAY